VFNREQLLSLDELPDTIREILVSNKDELPLFQSVFALDHLNEDQG